MPNKPRHFSWFKFEWKDWRDDKSLRRCTKETRGFWIDCIAEMEDQDTWFIEGTPDQLCRDLVCTMGEFERSIADLAETGAAEIVKKEVKSQQVVNIVSRRLLKKHNRTEYLALAKKRERERKAVNTMSTKSLLRKEKNREEREEREEKKEEKSKTTLSVFLTREEPPGPPEVKTLPVEIFIGLAVSGLCRRMGVKTLPNWRDWEQPLRWAFANDFSPDDVLECYDLIKQQSWREGAITAKGLTTELTNLSNLRTPKPPVPTGRNNGNGQRLSEREKSAQRGIEQRAEAQRLIDEGLREREQLRQGLSGNGA